MNISNPKVWMDPWQYLDIPVSHIMMYTTSQTKPFIPAKMLMHATTGGNTAQEANISVMNTISIMPIT